MHGRRWMLAVAVLMLCRVVSYGADEEPDWPLGEVDRSVLENGLQVLTVERPGSGLVRLELWVGTGSAHEEELAGSGITHVLEHAAFLGSQALEAGGVPSRPGYAAGEIQEEIVIGTLGGKCSATSDEDAVWFQIEVLPGDALDAIGLLEALVLRPTLDRESIFGDSGEIHVVLLERQSRMLDVNRQLNYARSEMLWGKWAYGVPGLGFVDGIKSLSVDSLRSYHRKRFVPNAMALVVVGDISHEQVLGRAREVFIGDIPDQPLHSRRPFQALPHAPSGLASGPRRRTLRFEGIGRLRGMVAFRAVARQQADSVHLDLVAEVLSESGTASSLGELLTKQADLRVLRAWAWTGSWAHAGEFVVTFVADPGAPLDDIEEAVQRVIDLVAARISDSDIARAKGRITSAVRGTWDSPTGACSMLGRHAVAPGGVDTIGARLATLQHATVQDVQRAMSTYLRKEERIAVFAVPQSPSPVPNHAIEPPATSPGIDIRRALGDRAAMVMHGSSSGERFSLAVALLGGSALESRGVSDLLRRVLQDAAWAPSDELDQREVHVATRLTPDALIVTLTGPTSEFAWVVRLLGRLLRTEDLNLEHLDAARNAQIETLGDPSRPQEVAFRLGLRGIRHCGEHFYSPLVDAETTRILGDEDVLNQWQRLRVAPVGIGAVGALPPEDEVETLLREAVSAIPRREVAPLPPAIEVAPLEQGRRIIADGGLSGLRWFFRGPSDGNDRAALLVAVRILNARLRSHLRDNLGIAYSVGAELVEDMEPPIIVLHCDTDHSLSLDRIRSAFQLEAGRMLTEDLPERAIRATGRALALDAARGDLHLPSAATRFALEALELPGYVPRQQTLDEIEALSARDVRLFCGAWLRPETAYEVSILGDTATETEEGK